MSTTFSKDGAQRIVRVVRKVEREKSLARQANGPRNKFRGWSEYVRIAGRKVAITGTRSRYIWVNVTNNTAQWSSVDMDPMPDGIEIYDTYVQEVHIPRLG